MKKFRSSLTSLLAILAMATFSPAFSQDTDEDASSNQNTPLLYNREISVHDPSTIVKCKDEYWTFSTGVGVQSQHSKDLVHWESGPRVFPDIPSWTSETIPRNRRGHFWAPDVIYLDGRYLLYYSVSSWGVNTSAIGLASNKTLDPDDPEFQWKDEGMVFRSFDEDDYNAIDPAVTLDADGKLWMCFGSYWGGIKLIELDRTTGMRIAPDSPIYSLADYDAIEASFISHHDSYYYLFLDWDRCCRGTNSTYNIRVGRSRNITGPYLDEEGKDMLKQGGTLFLGSTGNFIGPGHPSIYSEGGTNWFTFHFYDGGTEGRARGTLGMGQLKWGEDGWPFLVKTSNP